MTKTKKFIKTTVLGGVTVVLPVVLTVFFLRWLFNIIIGIIQPLTQVAFKNTRIETYLAHLIVVAVIVAICFLVGLSVRTRLGKFVYRLVEKRILSIAPGYSLFREAIKQFLGQEKRPFSRVALVQIFENSTLATAFITDEHADGRFTVFVPSGLNPTSGQIFHLEPQYVHLVDVAVDDTMRSIISCGAGSQHLLEKFR
jgi:uncharacterized membrane protein